MNDFFIFIWKELLKKHKGKINDFFFIDQFDRKTNSECPVDCETIQYITSLSYARFLSSPPIGMELLRDETYIKKLQTTMHTEEFQKYIE